MIRSVFLRKGRGVIKDLLQIRLGERKKTGKLCERHVSHVDAQSLYLI